MKLAHHTSQKQKLVLVGHYFIWHIQVLSDVLYHHPLILKLLQFKVDISNT